MFLSVERVETPARERHGGEPGAPGRIRIGQDGAPLPGKGEVRVPAGQVLVFETPGGGGFGAPSHRAPCALERDVADGLVSPEAARRVYGARE